MNRNALWLGFVACCAVFAPAARADVSATDLQVAARALGFMANAPQGRVRVGIVYSSVVRPSTAQAERLAEMLGTGLRAGNLVLQPVLVEARDADTADVDFFFLTEHLSADDALLSEVSAKRKIPCITTDIAQVERGACTIGVRSKPKIEVFVNRANAKASGTSFATAFRVMINEL